MHLVNLFKLDENCKCRIISLWNINGKEFEFSKYKRDGFCNKKSNNDIVEYK